MTKYTTVASLSRAQDRRRFVGDLVKALTDRDLYKGLTIRVPDGYTSVNIEQDALSAQVLITHGRKGHVPIVSWYDAKADLASVRGAWDDVNRVHHRKATSFPKVPNDVIGCLVSGMLAAKDGSAFRVP